MCEFRFLVHTGSVGDAALPRLTKGFTESLYLQVAVIGHMNGALQMESYPKFHNEVGVPIVRIGCREFECMGDKPPQDHPHIYLNMGDTGEIVCPYCSTLFRFDPSLRAHEADPADCAYSDME